MLCMTSTHIYTYIYAYVYIHCTNIYVHLKIQVCECKGYVAGHRERKRAPWANSRGQQGNY
jgi:hypothetical protein